MNAFLTFLLLFTSVFAQHYGKQNILAIKDEGIVTLSGTQVKLVKVKGDLKSRGASIQELLLKGSADLKNTLVLEDAFIEGPLVADNSEFKGDLVAESQKITLISCIANSITILSTHSLVPQVVDLRGSRVLGSIEFESGKGEVWISSQSEITGLIHGAKILRK